MLVVATRPDKQAASNITRRAVVRKDAQPIRRGAQLREDDAPIEERDERLAPRARAVDDEPPCGVVAVGVRKKQDRPGEGCGRQVLATNASSKGWRLWR
eukprot:2397130-Prymnesium_polylepis.2